MIFKRPKSSGVLYSDLSGSGYYLLFRAKGGPRKEDNNRLPDGFMYSKFKPNGKALVPSGWFRVNLSLLSQLSSIINFYLLNFYCWAFGRDSLPLYIVYKEGKPWKIVNYCFLKHSNIKRLPLMNSIDFEVGPYWTDDKYRGMSIAPAVINTVIADTMNGHLYALVRRDNLSSIRVVEKAGFKFFCSCNRRRVINLFSRYEPIIGKEDIELPKA